jgi:hypothetical protein
MYGGNVPWDQTCIFGSAAMRQHGISSMDGQGDVGIEAAEA